LNIDEKQAILWRMIRFDWDENKNRSNRKKHGVWFEEAQQAFNDPAALRYYDVNHSDDEDRFFFTRPEWIRKGLGCGVL
jgi:hypothetical protein